MSVLTSLSFNTGAKPAQQHLNITAEVSAGASQLPTPPLTSLHTSNQLAEER